MSDQDISQPRTYGGRYRGSGPITRYDDNGDEVQRWKGHWIKKVDGKRARLREGANPYKTRPPTGYTSSSASSSPRDSLSTISSSSSLSTQAAPTPTTPPHDSDKEYPWPKIALGSPYMSPSAADPGVDIEPPKSLLPTSPLLEPPPNSPVSPFKLLFTTPGLDSYGDMARHQDFTPLLPAPALRAAHTESPSHWMEGSYWGKGTAEASAVPNPPSLSYEAGLGELKTHKYKRRRLRDGAGVEESEPPKKKHCK
ncbi:hypothetical protein OQA88_6350 [Cercophora sp. LCS_1]